MSCTAYAVSALAKVFADEMPEKPLGPLSCLLDDATAFQVACYGEAPRNQWCTVEIISDLSPWIACYGVGLSPSAYPAHSDYDDNYLRTAPGLYPDRLFPLKDNRFKLVTGQWRSLWLQLDTDDKTPAGKHPVVVRGVGEGDAVLFEVAEHIEVLPVSLPKGTVCHTQWFHADCLADYYRVKPLSDEHFDIMERFIAIAVKRGINTILTPLYTPPLDTAPGGERTTVQLVRITKKGGAYAFDFSLLDRFVALCSRCGVTHYEMPHLFTQWGAKFAPKIIVAENGEDKKLFGWHTPATGNEYASFLRAFLPALTDHLAHLGIADRCFFHISDEPSIEHIEGYTAAKAIVTPFLGGFPIIDALSDYAFYETGAVRNPIPSNNKIEPFLQGGVQDLWTYYCTGQGRDVSNRFFSMPSSRNRILGVQLYLFNIKGFLHWGYNFYNDQYSLNAIDPYAVTDAGEAFPSGDPFLVYPGKDGIPEPSIRMMALHQAFLDIQALQLLEKRKGRRHVEDLIGDVFQQPITFSSFPKGSQCARCLENLRGRVNAELASR